MCDADDIPTNPHAAAAIARAERRLEILQELTEIGMNLARELGREAVEPPAPETAAPRSDPAESFARLSRAIRLTLTLETRTDAQLADLRAGVAIEVETRREAAAIRVEQAARMRSADHRAAIRREVETAFDIEIGDRDPRRGAFCTALESRLRYHLAYDDLDSMTLTQAVRRLCADLELNPDWSAWTEEGWAREPGDLRPASSQFREPSRRPIHTACEDDPPARPSG
jgi:hypothetical protein